MKRHQREADRRPFRDFMMIRTWLLISIVLSLSPVSANATHMNEWDFETPVNSFIWSNTTRTEYSYNPFGEATLESSHYLGPLTTTTLRMGAMDVFTGATPYPISFDLLLFPRTGLDPGIMPVFSVTSHGQVLLQTTDLSGFDVVGFLFPGGVILRIEFLYSPGPDPIDSSDCCGDVQIEWALTDGATWGIDNLSVVAIPEPSSSVLLGLGLAALSARVRWRAHPP